jgi:hypothetical protein
MLAGRQREHPIVPQVDSALSLYFVPLFTLLAVTVNVSVVIVLL